MKRTAIATAALLLTAALSLPAQSKRDTVVVIQTRSDTLTLTRSQGGTTKIRNRAGMDFDTHFYEKVWNKIRSNEIDPSGIGLGLIGTTAPAPFDFNMGNSIEVYLHSLQNCRSNGHVFSYGIGLDWKNFTLTGKSRMVKTGDASITTEDYPAETTPKLSRLRVFSFSFPLLYSYDFGGGWGFTLGPVLQLNAGSRISTKYRDADRHKIKDVDKKVHCNVATVDFMFQLNLKEVSFFVKYSPFNLMDKAYWPEFQHFSVGIAL